MINKFVHIIILSLLVHLAAYKLPVLAQIEHDSSHTQPTTPEELMDEDGNIDPEKVDSILRKSMGLEDEEGEEEYREATPIKAASPPPAQGIINRELDEEYSDEIAFKIKEKRQTSTASQADIQPFVDLFSGIFGIFISLIDFLVNDSLGNIIAILLVAVVIYFIAYLLRKNKAKTISSGEKDEEPENMTDEELIRKADLQELLEEAEEKANHKNALRYRYLILIKTMNEYDAINWSPALTNGNILRQLRNDQLRSKFAELTRAYEYIWFGGYQLSLEEYNRLKSILVEAKNITEMQSV